MRAGCGCTDDSEAVADNLVSLYTQPTSDQRPSIDDDDDDFDSPTEKRRRRCLSECDTNSTEPVREQNDDVTEDRNESSVTAETVVVATQTAASADNKENIAADAAAPTVNDDDAVDDALKTQSHTFKSPPQRRNVFAQSKETSVARQRFNINATKDKLASVEPTVEVRSRLVELLCCCETLCSVLSVTHG